MRKLFTLLLSSMLLLSGCGQNPKTEPSDIIINNQTIEEICNRGYLIAGCKEDVPGLSYYDQETNQWSGIEIEIAYQTAAELFGVSAEEAKEKNLVEFIGVTVADRETALEEGTIDCMLATYTITEERKTRFSFSEPYYIDYIGLMVRDYPEDSNSLGSQEIRSIADLDGKYIGIPQNATTRKDFISYLDTLGDMKITPIFCEYKSYEELYQALKKGDIDAIAVDAVILNGYDDDTTKILSNRFSAQKYGVAVCKEKEPLLSMINQAIKNISMQ